MSETSSVSLVHGLGILVVRSPYHDRGMQTWAQGTKPFWQIHTVLVSKATREWDKFFHHRVLECGLNSGIRFKRQENGLNSKLLAWSGFVKATCKLQGNMPAKTTVIIPIYKVCSPISKRGHLSYLLFYGFPLKHLLQLATALIFYNYILPLLI